MNRYSTHSDDVSDQKAEISPAPLLNEEQARQRSEDFRKCCRELRSPTPRTRAQATKALAECGTLALEPLQLALVDLEAEVRLAAIHSLAAIGGPLATGLLIRAVQDDQLQTRVAAAEALGMLAGEEALLPLKEAYLRCFMGRSPRRHRFIGSLLLLAVTGLLLIYLKQALSGSWIAAVNLLFPVVYLSFFVGVGFYLLRSRRDTRTIMAALLKVAERSPRPDLDGLLPELQVITRDRLMYDPAAREAARAAAEHIKSLSAEFLNLPVPAAPAPDAAEALPIPAVAMSPDRREDGTSF